MESLRDLPWFGENDLNVAGRTRKRKRLAIDNRSSSAQTAHPAIIKSPDSNQGDQVQDVSSSSQTREKNSIPASDNELFQVTKEPRIADGRDASSILTPTATDPTTPIHSDFDGAKFTDRHEQGNRVKHEQGTREEPVPALSVTPGKRKRRNIIAVQADYRSLRTPKGRLSKIGSLKADEGLTDPRSTTGGHLVEKHRRTARGADHTDVATTPRRSPMVTAHIHSPASTVSDKSFLATTENPAASHRPLYTDDKVTASRLLRSSNGDYRSPYSLEIPSPALRTQQTTIASPDTNLWTDEYVSHAEHATRKRRLSKVSSGKSDLSTPNGEHDNQSTGTRSSVKSGKRRRSTKPARKSVALASVSDGMDRGIDATTARRQGSNKAVSQLAEREGFCDHVRSNGDIRAEYNTTEIETMHAVYQSPTCQASQELEVFDDAVTGSDDASLPAAKFRLEVYLDSIAGFLYLSKDCSTLQFIVTETVEQQMDLIIPLVAMCQAPTLTDLGSNNMELCISILNIAEERIIYHFRFPYMNKTLNAANRVRISLLDSLLALQTSDADCVLAKTQPILPELEKPFHCEQCGGRWKNLEGIRYHVTKAKVPCNPDYVPVKKGTSELSHAHAQNNAEDLLIREVSENADDPTDLISRHPGAEQSSSSSLKDKGVIRTSRGRTSKAPTRFQSGTEDRDGTKETWPQVPARGIREQKSSVPQGETLDDDPDWLHDENHPGHRVTGPRTIAATVVKHKPPKKKKAVSSDRSTWQNTVIILQRKDGSWSQNALLFYTGRRSKGPRWPDNPFLGPVTFMQDGCDSTWSLEQSIPCVEPYSDIRVRRRRKRADNLLPAPMTFMQNGSDSTWSLETFNAPVRLHSGLQPKQILEKTQRRGRKLEKALELPLHDVPGQSRAVVIHSSDSAYETDRQTSIQHSLPSRLDYQDFVIHSSHDPDDLTLRGPKTRDHLIDSRQLLSRSDSYSQDTEHPGALLASGRYDQDRSGVDATDLVDCIGVDLGIPSASVNRSRNISLQATRSDASGTARTRRSVKDRSDSKTIVDGKSFNIQKARHATAIPADVDLIPAQLVQSVSVAEISTNPDQLAKRGKRSLLAFMSQEEELRLVIAVYLIRTLTGGLDKTIDWVLVATVFPSQAMTFCKQSWALAVQTHSSVLKSFARNFDDVFLEAYASGEVVSIDYDCLATYDWGKLVDWAMTRLDLTKYGPSEGLPESRAALDLTHGFQELRDPDWRDEYFDPIKPVHRRIEAATSLPFTAEVEDDSEIEVITDTSIAKSWIRASIATPAGNFREEVVNSRLSTIPKSFLDKAFSALLSERVIVHKNRGRPMPGRPYDLGEPVYNALKKHLTEDHFLQACSMKAELDRVFSRREEHQIVWTSNEGEVLALINMQAAGRVELVMHDLPAHELGLLDAEHQYQTKMMDKKKLRFRIGVIPTAAYLHDVNHPQLKVMFDGNHNPPLQVQGALPLWVDINGAIIWSLWKGSAIAVLCVVAQRPGIRMPELQRMTNPALTAWEIRLLLNWLLEVGAIVCLDKVKECWNAGEWWWLIAGKL